MQPDLIDPIFEQTETFFLNATVTSGNTDNIDPVGIGTITESLLPPTVTIAGTTTPESSNVVFTATLSGLSSTNVVLTVLTGNDLTLGANQATSGLDYNPITTPVTITILAGQLTGSTTVLVPALIDWAVFVFSNPKSQKSKKIIFWHLTYWHAYRQHKGSAYE